MEITIFDVEHGFCSLIKFPSGETMLIDCGHNSTTGWRPSLWMKQNGLQLTNLTISHVDEDHVSDLPNIYVSCKPQSITKNPYLTSAWVRSVKDEFGMGDGVEKACEMLNEYIGPPPNTNWGGVFVKNFFHSLADFQDENSLSLATFVISGNMGVLFSGDLTVEAWQKFLNNTEFCDLLKKVNIFVASHHGREDGYEPAVFKVCKPSVIIISDKAMVHGTQEVNYSQHASGIIWNKTDIRKVLTTRNDGSLRIQKNDFGGYHINSGVNVEIISNAVNPYAAALAWSIRKSV